MIPVIEFDQVTFEYGAPTKRGLFGRARSADASQGPASGVHDVSFAVHPGEFVAVIGNNGAGKTTLSKLANGLLKPQAGTVRVDGVPTAELRTSALAARVGMLFQNPDRQICQSTVLEEITFGLRLQGAERADEHAARVAEDFGLPADATPFALSRGERQRLALASVVAGEPGVLILDEPTTGLDYRECTRIMTRVCELNHAGTAVIMVCHDMELVADFAQRVVVMANGRIVADSTPEEVFRDRAALECASVMPPQMVELALRLEEGLGREGSASAEAFSRVMGVRDMVAAVASCARGAGAAAEVVAAAEAIVRGESPEDDAFATDARVLTACAGSEA